eukprot:4467476-Pleurochrysis_carterae.AAC.1
MTPDEQTKLRVAVTRARDGADLPTVQNALHLWKARAHKAHARKRHAARTLAPHSHAAVWACALA